METDGGQKKTAGSSNLPALLRFRAGVTPTPPETTQTVQLGSSGDQMGDKNELDTNTPKKKYGGWKAMPFILGNDSFERLASFGLTANFLVYLTRELHMSQVGAVNLLNIWNGVNNFIPLLGAFVADSYSGRFIMIAIGSFASLLGMLTLSLTAWLPKLHPPACSPQQLAAAQCVPLNKNQYGVLILSLIFQSLGTGGIRSCSTTFGVDQFDAKTEEGKKQLGSFFNLYYATFTVIIIFSMTVVVYIQDAVSWKWGFGIPTICMFVSIILFFIGMKIYVYAKPDGSVFSGFVQVFTAAFHKRKVKLPVYGNGDGLFYDPPIPDDDDTVLKLAYTTQLSWLSKAAVIADGDEIQEDGTPANKWRLCSLQKVEEVKCLVRVVPIWVAGIVSYLVLIQGGTFVVLQALKMDRHLGKKFQIPAGSIGLMSYVTIAIWVPVYDRLVVPALRRITKHPRGITVLQRMGVGVVFSILTMLVSGVTENARRASAIKHGDPVLGVAPMSVLWLSPQLVLMGLCEAFYIIGLVEFFNMEFPEHFRTIGNSLFGCSLAAASYISTVMITIVHKTTKTSHSPDWLANDINKGKLDYYFYIIAAMAFLNLIYFVFCARRYHYKDGSSQPQEQVHVKDDDALATIGDKPHNGDVELVRGDHNNV